MAVNPRNKVFCLATDIAKRLFELLEGDPNRPDDLTIVASPEIPLEKHDLPFLSIDIQKGDAADQTITMNVPSDGSYVTVLSLLTINIRVDMTETNNNGIEATAPIHQWAMRLIMNDRALRQMCEGPIMPVGWQLYGDTHEVATKGLIQGLEFRHKLNLSTAWNEPSQDPSTP
jgi:hypothetical protein